MRRLATLAAATELVLDKLPATPSRLMPPALAVRLAFGAISGALAGRAAGGGWPAGATAGASGALVASVVGVRVRGHLAARLRSDLPGALAEDAAAFTLAAVSSRR